MHLKLKNKKIVYGKYKLKCAIGKRGISKNKSEGDKKTPKGTFKLLYILYRPDRIRKLQTKLKKVKIKKNYGWCDDVKSKKYNKLIKFPFNYSAERLFLKSKIYDIIIVLNYNIRPIKTGLGSAIFLHLSNKYFSPTNGCVAISKKDMLRLVKHLKSSSKISIF